MANFALTALAAKMVCPSNEVIMDNAGIPGIYVQRAPRKLSELLTGCEDNSVHPAFIVDGKQVSKLYIGKYQAVAHANKLYSLPGEDPLVNINHDNFVQYARNKGAGHHSITAAEWAFLALSAKKDKRMPLGNNSWGKDASESDAIAIPTYIWPDEDTNKGKTARVATGTGPVTWSDTGDLTGIWDLNGNIWERCPGVRLVKGELQVLKDNNAASDTANLAANSPAWQAVNAAATSWNDLLIQPNGQGTTANSIKLDFVDSHWQWQKSAIAHAEDSSRYALFAKTTIEEGVSAICALYLRAMAFAPEAAAAEADYNGDGFWANNAAAERCAFRGGYFGVGSQAGVFALVFSGGREYVDRAHGGRVAYKVN